MTPSKQFTYYDDTSFVSIILNKRHISLNYEIISKNYQIEKTTTKLLFRLEPKQAKLLISSEKIKKQN